MRSSWTSCVTHSIGSGRHIGIWSSSVELRGKASIPKLCHLGPEHGTSLFVEMGSRGAASPGMDRWCRGTSHKRGHRPDIQSAFPQDRLQKQPEALMAGEVCAT
jgi:hypothetical protein